MGNVSESPPRNTPKSPLLDVAESIARGNAAAYNDGKAYVAQRLLHYVKTQLVVAEANSSSRVEYASGVYDTLLGVIERCNEIVTECNASMQTLKQELGR